MAGLCSREGSLCVHNVPVAVVFHLRGVFGAQNDQHTTFLQGALLRASGQHGEIRHTPGKRRVGVTVWLRPSRPGAWLSAELKAGSAQGGGVT